MIQLISKYKSEKCVKGAEKFMSEYKQYLQERDRIDYLIQTDYKIKNIIENLSGAFVDFERTVNSKTEVETLQVVTPEGRKYFSVVLIKQQKEYS